MNLQLQLFGPLCECHGERKTKDGILGGRQGWRCRIKHLASQKKYVATEAGRAGKNRRDKARGLTRARREKSRDYRMAAEVRLSEERIAATEAEIEEIQRAIKRRGQ